jgi:hypothetical protein
MQDTNHTIRKSDQKFGEINKYRNKEKRSGAANRVRRDFHTALASPHNTRVEVPTILFFFFFFVFLHTHD